MTIWIMPELDRGGWAVCMFWLQDGKQDEAPTDRNSCLIKPQRVTFGPPFRHSVLYDERHHHKATNACYYYCSDTSSDILAPLLLLYDIYIAPYSPTISKALRRLTYIDAQSTKIGIKY